MALIKEQSINRKNVVLVAELMASSARTAPKARGVDNLEIAVATGETVKKLADTMKKHGKKYEMSFFLRDSENIRNSHAVVLIGTRIKTQGLSKCGMCGFKNCAEKEKHEKIPCVFNTNDLGIALGSAVEVASRHHVDNRIMFSAGQAALKLNLLGSGVKICFAIPLSVSPKNPFFDRPLVR